MKVLHFLYNKSHWLFWISFISNIIIDFISPNSFIGYENICKIRNYLILKVVFMIVGIIFAVIYFSKLYIRNNVDISSITASSVLGSCTALIFGYAIYTQSPCSTVGFVNIFKTINSLQTIVSSDCSIETATFTKFDNELFVSYIKGEKADRKTHKINTIFTFYGLNAYTEKDYDHIEESPIISFKLSADDYNYYNKILGSAKNNDEFIVKYYIDENEKNLRYIESIQYIEKEYSPSYSEKISIKENSVLYTITKSNNSGSENINWLLIKDGKILKIVGTSEINEFKLRKDMSEGMYTILLCTDYNLNTGEYTQISNSIEIVI